MRALFENISRARDPRFGIREWNPAVTRVSLAAAALERFSDRTLTEISVQELCDSTSISTATFFNYFPKKGDLVIYLTQLVQIDVGYHSATSATTSALRRIEAAFDRTAELIQCHPGGMEEIIATQAQLRAPPVLPEIGDAERAVAFPDLDTAAVPSAEPLRDAFARELRSAVSLHELPGDVDVEQAALMLHCIYFGVTFGTWLPTGALADRYRELLHLLWGGLDPSRRVDGPRSEQLRGSGTDAPGV